MHSAIFKGFLLALTAGTSWGSMAVAAQYLMTHYGFSAEISLRSEFLEPGLL